MAGPSDENKLAQELLLQMKDYTPTVRLLCLPSTPHTPRAAIVKKIKMPVLCCRPSPSANHPWLPRPAHQIPDEVTQYFLTLSGFQCPDERVTRLVSLATHKFVADLTNDALQNCKMRQQARGGKADARLVLTTEDLAASSREFGISLKKPTYYADTPGPGGSSGPPPTDGQQ